MRSVQLSVPSHGRGETVTREQVAAMGDQAIAIMERRDEYDVETRCLAEWVALWAHTEHCATCDQHGLCERGLRLAAALDRAAGAETVHAVA